MTNKLHWQCSDFHQLSNKELYEIMALRQEVFVVEQNCPYLDADGKDIDSYHLMGWNINEYNDLVAYLRILPPGLKYSEVSFGRVIISFKHRGKGLGREIIRVALNKIHELYPNKNIRISAQAHLENFYAEFGFKKIGQPYHEDKIPHIDMLK